jgi:uncharacterized membrane protein (DUF373 family)
MNVNGRWHSVSEKWAILTYYQRFESMVAFVLTIVIGLIVVVALVRLSFAVVAGLVLGVVNPLDQKVFQSIFGEIMTLLIALEFNHTLQYVVTRQQSVIQTKVVMLIALLALARKVIVFDLHEMSPELLFGLAAITLALGSTYWLMRERDDRLIALAKASG